MIDVLIVGGGLIGMSTAYVIKKNNPNLEIVLCESTHFLGDQTSARNSGVLHSGIYYKKDSNKHVHCMKGLELWPKYAEEMSIEIQNCGKFIVSSDSKELKRIVENAKNNNVVTRYTTEEENVDLNEYVNFEEAIFVESTSIVDVADVVKRMDVAIHNIGVIVLTESEVSIQNGKAFINGELCETKSLINAAGLGAVTFRKELGFDDLEDFYVRGDYLSYTKSFYNKTLIYPLPDKRLNTLGVHTCINVDGSVYFGPSAKKIDSIDYSNENMSFEEIVNETLTTFKGVDKSKLSPMFSGIRPKVKRDNKVLTDFEINFHELDNFNYVELVGIESPGLTSCFSLAEYVNSKLVI